MTTINIKLSQAVVDAMNDPQADLGLNSDIGSLVDMFAAASYAINEDYRDYTSYSFLGSTLRMNFADGASLIHGGVQRFNPNASSGTATASTTEFLVPGLFSLNAGGQFNYDYVLGPQGPLLQPSAQGATINSFRVTTLLPTNSPDYDPQLGNAQLALNGVLTITGNTLQGTISSVTAAADRFVLSSVIEGRFDVSVDLDVVGRGLAYSAVEGTLTAYRTSFHDGSYLNVTNAQTRVGAFEVVEDTLLGASAGDDDIRIELPARLPEDMTIEAGAGNDRLALAGGGGRLHADGGAGNDVVTLLGGSHRVAGGAGLDTVKLASLKAEAAVTAGVSPSAFSVRDASGALNQLVNVERLVFSDATLALDIDGNAGQAYRLYQAAYNRTPDSGGLGFWIAAMDRGETLNTVAQHFVNSDEFRNAYGATLGNQEVVTRLYENILHRTPDAGGLAFYTGVLDSKAATLAEVLAAISESNENKVGLIGVIGNGFTYTPFEHG